VVGAAVPKEENFRTRQGRAKAAARMSQDDDEDEDTRK
jgi:hypothetical protein